MPRLIGAVERLEVNQTFATLLLIVVMALACIGVFGFASALLNSLFPGATHAATVTLTSGTASTTVSTSSSISQTTGSAVVVGKPVPSYDTIRIRATRF